MRLIKSVLLAVCSLSLANSAAALTAAETAAIDNLIEQSLQEQKVFLTCSATLDQRNNQLISEMWTEISAETIVLLSEINYPPESIDRFRENAELENIFLPEDTLWSDVITFCQENSDWQAKLHRMTMIILPTEITKVVSGN